MRVVCIDIVSEKGNQSGQSAIIQFDLESVRSAARPLEMPPRRSSAPAPQQDHPHPKPLLRLKIDDLANSGARRFLDSVDVLEVLEEAVTTVLDLLYPIPCSPRWPGTRSITLIVDSFDGVAYTLGKSLDKDHKEIHFSTSYINDIKPALLQQEIKGVLVHEMVHCWQWNGNGTAPAGLIEGIADWVRLKAKLGPPHWRKRGKDLEWDCGYDITAYFLEWLEEKYGGGIVPRMNMLMKDGKYVKGKCWANECGLPESVETLWEEYKKSLGDEEGGVGGTESPNSANSEENKSRREFGQQVDS